MGRKPDLPRVSKTEVGFQATIIKIRGTESGSKILLTVMREGKEAVIKGGFSKTQGCKVGLTYQFSCTHNTSLQGGEPADWNLSKVPTPSNQPTNPSRG